MEASSSAIRRERVDVGTPSKAAAFVKLFASATATNSARSRKWSIPTPYPESGKLFSSFTGLSRSTGCLYDPAPPLGQSEG